MAICFRLVGRGYMHRSKERWVSVWNAFADGACTFDNRNAPDGVEETAVSSQQKQRRTCAPLPRCRCRVSLSSARSRVVIESSVLFYDRSGFDYKPHESIRTSFRSRLRVHDRTTARPHDRTTARPHDCTTARLHERATTTNYCGVSGICQAASP